jgi:hypothetical protein
MTISEALVKTSDVIRQLHQCTALQIVEVGLDTESELGHLEQQLRSLIDNEFAKRLRRETRKDGFEPHDR